MVLDSFLEATEKRDTKESRKQDLFFIINHNDQEENLSLFECLVLNS